MNNSQDQTDELVSMLALGERAVNEFQQPPLLEIWKEEAPGKMINKSTGMVLSMEDFVLYRNRAGWGGIGFMIFKKENS